MTTRLRRALGPALLAAALGGYGEAPAVPETLHTLTGTVTQNGKAVTGGGLIFVPESGMSGARVPVGEKERIELRLERLRQKLLDLSTTNRMLSFHSRSSWMVRRFR